MSTYYKHTKRESYDIPYSFCCEQCMKESGTLQATIVGDQAEVNSSFRNLSESNQERLDNLAHKYLVQAVKKAHTNATEKQIFVKAFRTSVRIVIGRSHGQSAMPKRKCSHGRL